MKNTVLLFVLITILGIHPKLVASQSPYKPRVIVTTDGEVDDRSSMVRFLMYASDYDVEGIIQNNSIFQKKGHSVDQWIEEVLTYYDEVLPNLRKHHPDYPSAEYLQSVIRVGNENPEDLHSAPHEMKTQDTPGADLIIAELLEDDPRPLHILCWGGANTVAFALWKLKNEYPQDFTRAVERLWIYGITYNLTNKAQDGGFVWIIENMPEVKIYTAATWARTYSYDSVDGERHPSYNPKEVQRYMDRDWTRINIKMNHGPLGAYYPQSYISEGDTPSFLHLIGNGLEAHLDYTLGGWGGRAVFKKGNHLVDAPDEKHKAVYRWTIDSQNDFAARMDWCVADEYSKANHQPVVKLDHELDFTVKSGSDIMLSAKGTYDPDGDDITFQWWQYEEAGSYDGLVKLQNPKSPKLSFVTPQVNQPETIQIILQVSDSGSPTLNSYKRIIVTVLP